tara:strand:- start:970 stop:1284 length:315 start_codon:yes stop_codon:yes gene_type:complete
MGVGSNEFGSFRVFPNIAKLNCKVTLSELTFQCHTKSASWAPKERDFLIFVGHRPAAFSPSYIFLQSGHTGNFSGLRFGTHFFPQSALTGLPVTAELVMSVLLT